MPPRPKYTREQIAKAAFCMVAEDGLTALTARGLAKRLGVSISPIFSMFDGMEDVRQAARELAMTDFLDYVGDFRAYTPAFKRFGLKLVSYGVNRPELFKLLFLHPRTATSSVSDFMQEQGELLELCCGVLQQDYDLTREQAELMVEQMMTYGFGLGAMCAMGACTLSEPEISRRLGLMFAGTRMLMQSEKCNAPGVSAEPKNNASENQEDLI